MQVAQTSPKQRNPWIDYVIQSAKDMVSVRFDQ